MKKIRISLLISLVICLFLTGCPLRTSGVNIGRTYIDSPLNETTWWTGAPLAISIHDDRNVYPHMTKVKVIIDKVPYDASSRKIKESSVESISPHLYQAKIFWTPDEVGRYQLIASGYHDGRWEEDFERMTSIFINVEMGGRGGGEPATTPLPTMAAPTRDAAAPWIDLWADQYSLTAGACTSLRWDAQHVDALLLDGEAVAFNGSRQVCPTASRTYTLRGTSASEQVETSVTITVTAPPTSAPPAPQPADTSGPTLTSPSLSAAKIFDNPACGPTSNTINITAQDPSGISRVELSYRARDVKATGSWRVISMSPGSGGKYSAVLSIGDLNASLNAPDPRTVDVIIKAWDGAGNISQSGQVSFLTDYCLT